MNKLGSKLILFFGAPGSGKGTQARLLPNFHIVSAGDTLREAAQTNPSLESILSSGKLVPEHITEEFLTNKIDQLCRGKSHQNILLEGYPRSYFQSLVVEKWMNRKFGYVQFNHENTLGFHLMVSRDEIINRLRDRWICNTTGRSYHTTFNPPRIPGIDDDTGESLTRRRDDLNPDAINNRITTYETETIPVIERMRSRGYKILDIPSDTIENVQNKIILHLVYMGRYGWRGSQQSNFCPDFRTVLVLYYNRKVVFSSIW
jgi:adenylate kinase family enzyme